MPQHDTLISALDSGDITGGAGDLCGSCTDAGSRCTLRGDRLTGETCARPMPDGTTTPADILAVIDCLNGVAGFDCDLSNTDTDRSNEAGPPDILRVIDLLNGAAAFEVWLGAQLDITGCE